MEQSKEINIKKQVKRKTKFIASISEDKPNSETIKVIREVEAGIHSKHFSSMEDLIKDLES